MTDPLFAERICSSTACILITQLLTHRLLVLVLSVLGMNHHLSHQCS